MQVMAQISPAVQACDISSQQDGGPPMDAHALNTLADQIQAATLYDAGLCRVAFDLVETELPALDKAMIRNGALGETDAVLMVIAHALPDWSIVLRGTASDAKADWTCTLRRSDRRDDDPALGVGKGPKLGNVLIAALLRGLARVQP
jgi:hypothetical protein